MDVIKNHGSNTTILLNAANYFLIQDKDIAEEFLKKAEALEPQNPEISKRLARLYKLAGSSQLSNEKKRRSSAKSQSAIGSNAC